MLRYSMLIITIKYMSYSSNIAKIEDRMNLNGNEVYIWTLLKLLGSSIALCHIVGCLYYSLAYVEIEYLGMEEENWVTLGGFDNADPFKLYTESYYWALATVALIGTKGTTLLETIYCIFTLLWTVGVFATILSTVTMVWEEKESK